MGDLHYGCRNISVKKVHNLRYIYNVEGNLGYVFYDQRKKTGFQFICHKYSL
jgi:hypothetical protein